ncbi:MAG: hypothetical protein OHK0048_18310 [Rhodoferax sp.]
MSEIRTATQDIRQRLLTAHLPALPQVVLKLLALGQSSDAGPDDYAAVLALEPALAARVVAVANSAAYAHPAGALDLPHACQRLGSQTLKILALSESVLQTFRGFAGAQAEDLKRFWGHSLRVALLTQSMARNSTAGMEPDQAYLAGLLHDVGRLALHSAAPELYADYLSARDDVSLCELEQSLLHISHTEAGAWLARRWKLSDAVVEALLYHHEDSNLLNAAGPLALALMTAHRLLPAPDGSVSVPEAWDIPDALGLTRDALCSLRADCDLALENLARDLNVPLSPEDGVPAEQIVPRVRSTDAGATQAMVNAVRDRALMADMHRTLTQCADNASLFANIRHHAHLLLGLSCTQLLVLRESQKTLIPVAMNEALRPATGFYALAEHPLLAQCVQQKAACWSSVQAPPPLRWPTGWDPGLALALALHDGQHCCGVLLALVPQDEVHAVQSQPALLQAFAQCVGSVLWQRIQVQQQHRSALTAVKQEQQTATRKIAHEINNPIGVIQNYLEVIDDKLERNEPVRQELSKLGVEVRRVGELVRNLGRDAPPKPVQTVDVQRLCTDVLHLLRQSRFFPTTTQLVNQLPEAPMWVLGSPDGIKQILLNLLKNAHESLGQGGGKITVGGGQRVDQAGRSYIQLSIADTGPGLSEAAQARLFQPQTSTKPGENRGLGLSIVKDLVQSMGGAIRFQTGPQGTTFTLLLPCAQATRPA